MEIKQVNKAEILQKAVNNYTRMGYRVTSQTSDTAQLIKPKKFSCLLAVILLLLIILPLIIYIFMYMAQKDETVYLRVDDLGALYITDEHGKTRRVGNLSNDISSTVNTVKKWTDFLK